MRRFFAYALVRLALIGLGCTAVLVATVPLQQWLRTHGLRDSSAVEIGLTWVLLAALTVVVIVVERLAAGRRPASIGMNVQGAGRAFGGGVALGALLFSAVVLTLALGGCYRAIALHPSWGIATAVLLFLPSAALEELLFRGVLFRLVEESAGTWIALAVSAALFGAAHAFNPGATWLSSVAIALEAGVLLGATFVLTRNLWLPIGLHFAWNFCEGPIFGTQISGRTLSVDLVSARLVGPQWLTGGAFGPEAGVAALGICTIAAAIVLLYAQRQGRLVPLRRPRPSARGTPL